MLARQAVVAPRGRRFDSAVRELPRDRGDAPRAADRHRHLGRAAGREERARLAAGLSAIYGGKVHVNTVVDPRVMGGIKVEIGDEVIDGTVIRKLDAARRAMGA